jgi:hypothetical protein
LGGSITCSAALAHIVGLPVIRPSEGALGTNYCPKSLKHDQQVEPKGPMVDVKHIQLNFFFV